METSSLWYLEYGTGVDAPDSSQKWGGNKLWGGIVCFTKAQRAMTAAIIVYYGHMSQSDDISETIPIDKSTFRS